MSMHHSTTATNTSRAGHTTLGWRLWVKKPLTTTTSSSAKLWSWVGWGSPSPYRVSCHCREIQRTSSQISQVRYSKLHSRPNCTVLTTTLYSLHCTHNWTVFTPELIHTWTVFTPVKNININKEILISAHCPLRRTVETSTDKTKTTIPSSNIKTKVKKWRKKRYGTFGWAIISSIQESPKLTLRSKWAEASGIPPPIKGGGGGVEVVKSKVRGKIKFLKSLESSSAEGGEITRVQEKGKGPLLHQITDSI